MGKINQLLFNTLHDSSQENSLDSPIWIMKSQIAFSRGKYYVKAYMYSFIKDYSKLKEIKFSIQYNDKSIVVSTYDFYEVESIPDPNFFGVVLELPEDYVQSEYTIRIISYLSNKGNPQFDEQEQTTYRYSKEQQNQRLLNFVKTIEDEDNECMLVPTQLSSKHWQCFCGRINHSEECQNCGIKEQAIRSILDEGVTSYYCKIFVERNPLYFNLNFSFDENINQYRNEYEALGFTLEDMNPYLNLQILKEQYNQEIEEDRAYNSKRRKLNYLLLSVVTILIVIVSFYQFVLRNSLIYMRGNRFFEEENYVSASKEFDKILEFKDSLILMQESRMHLADQYFEEHKIEKALSEYIKIEGYMHADTKITECRYLLGIAAFEAGDYSTARQHLDLIKDYEDVKDYLLKAKYNIAKQDYDRGNYTLAAAGYDETIGYLDSEKMKYISLDQDHKQLFDSSYNGIGREDAKDIFDGLLKFKKDKDVQQIIISDRYWKISLLGTWNNSAGYYFKAFTDKDGDTRIEYILPVVAGEYYRFKNNHVLLGDNDTWEKAFKISLDLNLKKMTVYCYKDGKTYILYKK